MAGNICRTTASSMQQLQGQFNGILGFCRNIRRKNIFCNDTFAVFPQTRRLQRFIAEKFVYIHISYIFMYLFIYLSDEPSVHENKCRIVGKEKYFFFSLVFLALHSGNIWLNEDLLNYAILYICLVKQLLVCSLCYILRKDW